MFMEPSDVIHRISEKFALLGHPIDQKQLTERLNRLTDEFGIPLPEAERTLVSDFSRQFNLPEGGTAGKQERTGNSLVTPIAGLEPETWVTLEGMVTVIFPPRSPSIAQSGILADKTGSVRFTIWARSNAPPVETGTWYRFSSAVTDEYNGQVNFKVHGGTTITPLGSDEIPVDSPVPIQDLREGLCTVEGRVTTLFPPRSPSIAQSGILADTTGTINFTIWANAGLQELKEGETYQIRHGLVDLYNGRLGLKAQQGTVITPVSDTARVTTPVSVTPIGSATNGIVTLEGMVVASSHPASEALRQTGTIADNSGAIRFTIRAADGSEELKENTWYRIEGAVIDQYRGALHARITKDTIATVISGEQTLNPAFSPIDQLKPGVSCIRAKMVQDWETNHERMLQSGIVGDETGTIRFVTWQDPQAERLKPDMVYRIYWAAVDEYNGQLSLTLSDAALIEEPGDIEVKSESQEVTGALVHISPGSGLIRRCPVEGCGRVLSRQNFCQVHEFQPEYTYDLRIKGWIDNGRQTWDTIIGCEAVLHLTGLSIDQAKEMAENNPLGPETVFYHIYEMLLGRYFRCTGRVIENRLFAKGCEPLFVNQNRLFELINRANTGKPGENPLNKEEDEEKSPSSDGIISQGNGPVREPEPHPDGQDNTEHKTAPAPGSKTDDGNLQKQTNSQYKTGFSPASVHEPTEEYDTDSYDRDNEDEWMESYREEE